MDNIKTAIQLYGVCIGLSFLCVMMDCCSKTSRFNGEKLLLSENGLTAAPDMTSIEITTMADKPEPFQRTYT